MARLVVEQVEKLEDLKNVGLREEGDAWAAQQKVIAARAECVPDTDGWGKLECFFIPDQSRGMVGTAGEDDSSSDWIEATSVQGLFKKYMAE